MTGRTAEQILALVTRYVEEHNEAPGRQRFEKWSGVRRAEWHGRFWTSWGAVLADAGVEGRGLQQSIPDEEVLKQLALLSRKLMKFPTNAERRLEKRSNHIFPSHSRIDALGRNSEVLGRLIHYCDETHGFEDVATVLRNSDARSKPPTTAEAATASAPTGFVYLMKSGRHHKIGRSNDSGRRRYEIGTKTPEPVDLVHELETDDPIGIERYWHERFADKRTNGEWFKLTKQDVRAFTSRGSSM